MFKRIIGLLLAIVVLVGTIYVGQNYILEAKNDRIQPITDDNDIVAIVFFSATNVTDILSKRMGLMLSSPVFEIDPKVPYSKEDLDYKDKTSRSSIETKDKNSRPEIASEFKLDTYQKILLGYPIWHGLSPRIIQTFLETYDLKGKTIYLFCTSGSSDGIKSFETLRKFYPQVMFISGKCFKTTPTDEELREFLKIVK